MFTPQVAELLPRDVMPVSEHGPGLSGRDQSGGGAKRILLLSNDLSGGGGLARSLGEAGGIVTKSAEISEELLDPLGASAFDTIVVDLRPDLLGYQAIRSLRAARVILPLLFISARSTPEASQRARALGADDVAILPIDHHTMKTWIDRLTPQRPVTPPGSRFGSPSISTTAPSRASRTVR